MDDRRLISSTRVSSSEVARATFTPVRKGGLDPQEVRLYLEAVARELAHLEARVQSLSAQLADAQEKAAHPTIDEATLASALGTQSAAILRSAHEEAGRVTAEAQERAAQLFAESQQRGASHLIEAQERSASIIAEAESSASQIELESRLAAERLIESAKVNGEALVDRGREQGRAMVEQANEARRTVLNDLTVKRKALHLQIDQLRAARDSLSGFVATVRDQVESLLTNLAGSDDAARMAALEALRLRPPTREPTEEELLAGTPLREVPEVVPVSPDEAGAGAPAPRRARRAAPKADGPGAPAAVEEPTGVDVVDEIFARLRKATLDERGATAPPPRRAAAAKSTAAGGELFARRDAALDESLAALTRRVKRVLQDDQNSVLERLRDVKGMITTELEDEHDQRARYAEAARDALEDAAAAGGRFAFDEAGVSGPPASRAQVADVAADLAVTIVLALRRRILTDGSGTAVERANTAYKEWRGARVERLCADAARRAFSLGVVAASQGHPARFVVAPTDAPCDACALDARSGERLAGEPFPSGSAYPPLHAGCACAVVPVPAAS